LHISKLHTFPFDFTSSLSLRHRSRFFISARHPSTERNTQTPSLLSK
jgi:hypothetical protein